MGVGLDRRTLLVGATGLAAVAMEAQARQSLSVKDFLWGTAGAAYQIEGGNYASDLWVMEHQKPSIFREPSGDAADSFNRIEEDIELAASLGLNAHRFSIEWSRIEPEPGYISHAAISYYRRVLEMIRSRGMSPFVTYNHFTTPRWFAANGGFETREGIDPFVRYCTLVTENLGDLIGLAATFNEPNLGALLRWQPSIRALRPHIAAARAATAAAIGAPNWAPPVLGDFMIQQPIMIEAHERAYEAIREKSAGAFAVGVTLSLNDERPVEEGASLDAKIEQVMLPWTRAAGDFIGVQNYTYALVGRESDLPHPQDVELTQMGYPFAPDALEGVIRLVASRSDKPIYVTENGIATEDDARRIEFIDKAVAGVANCLNDGIDLRGYIHWSLLDNWEWFAGYGPKFGLVSVDRTTFKRTPKPSARRLGAIARIGAPMKVKHQ